MSRLIRLKPDEVTKTNLHVFVDGCVLNTALQLR